MHLQIRHVGFSRAKLATQPRKNRRLSGNQKKCDNEVENSQVLIHM